MKNNYEIRGNDVVVFVKGYDRIFECIIDLKDFEEVSSIKNRWYVSKSRGMYYVYYQPYINGKRTSVQLHQMLMGTFGKGRKGDVIVDHIDGDTMNNRRFNLQITTQLENVHKGKVFKNNTTGYKHIQWQESRGKYRVEVLKYGIYRFVGRFKELEKAIEARDIYLKELDESQRPNEVTE